jgi:hypothetical protein
MHMHDLERNIALFGPLCCRQKPTRSTDPTIKNRVNTSQEGPWWKPHPNSQYCLLWGLLNEKSRLRFLSFLYWFLHSNHRIKIFRVSRQESDGFSFCMVPYNTIRYHTYNNIWYPFSRSDGARPPHHNNHYNIIYNIRSNFQHGPSPCINIVVFRCSLISRDCMIVRTWFTQVVTPWRNRSIWCMSLWGGRARRERGGCHDALSSFAHGLCRVEDGQCDVENAFVHGTVVVFYFQNLLLKTEVQSTVHRKNHKPTMVWNTTSNTFTTDKWKFALP